MFDRIESEQDFVNAFLASEFIKSKKQIPRNAYQNGRKIDCSKEFPRIAFYRIMLSKN